MAGAEPARRAENRVESPIPVIRDYREFNRFRSYIEGETGLFELALLGYPWYHVVKEELNNGLVLVRRRPNRGTHDHLRRRDFHQKLHLLEGKYDYVFFSRAKMRRDGPENVLFEDILDYLSQRNRSFIILEEKFGDEFDARYLDSPYAPVTIPYEPLAAAVMPGLENLARREKSRFREMVEQLFDREDSRCGDGGFPSGVQAGTGGNGCRSLPAEADSSTGEQARFRWLLKERYLRRASQVPHILLRRALLSGWKTKAVFGGMGTHLAAGLSASRVTVEVGHGYFGRSTHPPLIPGEKLLEFHEKHLPLDRLLLLANSPDGRIEYRDALCPDGNRFNYGMPELRRYDFSESRPAAIRQRLEIGNRKVVLMVTTAWNPEEKLTRFISNLSAALPEIVLLVRAHPFYDREYSRKFTAENIRFVPDDHKYDLFRVADVVLSTVSSMAVEASVFTENVIVFPDTVYDSADGIRKLACSYPFAKIVTLEDHAATFGLINAMTAHPGGKKAVDPAGCSGELERLFERIEKLSRTNARPGV